MIEGNLSGRFFPRGLCTGFLLTCVKWQLIELRPYHERPLSVHANLTGPIGLCRGGLTCEITLPQNYFKPSATSD